MTPLAFTIPGEPRGKGRPKFSRRGGFVRAYTDAKTVSYENRVAGQAAIAYGLNPPLEGALVVDMVFRFVPPASTPKKRLPDMLAGVTHPAKKPDIDNLVKSVLDGLNGVIFKDDAQVVRVSVRKIYAETTGADITVEAA